MKFQQFHINMVKVFIFCCKGAWYLHLGRLSLGFGSGIQSYLVSIAKLQV